MLKIFLKSIYIFLALYFCISPCLSSENSAFGRYTGTLNYNLNHKIQNVKLDFISARNEENELKILAVFTLYFGEFGSREYVSYHYQNVNFNIIRSEFVLDQPDQDFTISGKLDRAGVFTGEVYSALAGGYVGNINLNQKIKSSELRANSIGEVSGEYLGVCNKKKYSLQLDTFRSTADTVRIGNPFSMYKIRGQLAVYDKDLCPNVDKKSCVINQITSGAYNFFLDNLALFGEQDQIQCKTLEKNILDCSGCIFNKVKQRPFEASKNILEFKSKKIVPIAKSETKDISPSGIYWGYVYHDFLKVYQLASINIVSYQESNAGSNIFRMSAVANLYFGDPKYGEVISYRFNRTRFNLSSKKFLFQRAEDDIDAILKVEDMRGGEILGDWHSIHFGKVGGFYFSKDLNPKKIANKFEMMPSLAGVYSSKNIDLHLAVYLSETPVNTVNPYFPLTFGGYFSYKDNIAENMVIRGGSYDFYTGHISLEIADGSRVVTGLVDTKSKNAYKLNWAAKGFARLLQSYDYTTFSKINDSGYPF